MGIIEQVACQSYARLLSNRYDLEDLLDCTNGEGGILGGGHTRLCLAIVNAEIARRSWKYTELRNA